MLIYVSDGNAENLRWYEIRLDFFGCRADTSFHLDPSVVREVKYLSPKLKKLHYNVLRYQILSILTH